MTRSTLPVAVVFLLAMGATVLTVWHAAAVGAQDWQPVASQSRLLGGWVQAAMMRTRSPNRRVAVWPRRATVSGPAGFVVPGSEPQTMGRATVTAFATSDS